MGTRRRKIECLWDWSLITTYEYRYPVIKFTSRSGEQYVKVSLVRDWINVWNLDYRTRVTFLGIEIETYDRNKIG